MKKRQLRTASHRFGLGMLVAALLLLAGCSKEEEADNTLPEGKYRMTFTATGLQAMPMSRATIDGTWEAKEQVAVKVGEEIKQYVAENSGTTTTLKVATDVTPFYWQNKEAFKVSAWYLGRGYQSALPTEWPVSSDQSDGGYPESDFLYACDNFQFGTSSSLHFYHQTAKVVAHIIAGSKTPESSTVSDMTIGDNNVDLKGSWTAPENVWAENTSKVLGSWSKVSSPGTITPKQFEAGDVSLNEGEKLLASYEALVIPQSISGGEKLFVINIKGYEPFCYKVPDEGIKWEAGIQYTYKITINGTSLSVTANENSLNAKWKWDGTDNNVTSKVPETGFTAADLKVGDYYYSDGTWSDGGYRKYPDGTNATLPVMPVLTDASGKSRTVSGIVLHLRNESSVKDTCMYEAFKGVPTGYVLSVDERDTVWIAENTQIHEVQTSDTVICGYPNTKLFYEMYGTKARAIDWCKGHASTAPVSSTSSVTVSTWYMPSQLELKMITKDLRPVLDAILSRIGGTPFQNEYYFTSGLMGRVGEYVWMYNPITGSDRTEDYYNDVKNLRPYRAMFAFQLKTPVSKQNH